jgi:hypothetical protein
MSSSKTTELLLLTPVVLQKGERMTLRDLYYIVFENDILLKHSKRR